MRNRIYSNGFSIILRKLGRPTTKLPIFSSLFFVRGEGAPPIRSRPPTLADADLPIMASTVLSKSLFVILFIVYVCVCMFFFFFWFGLVWFGVHWAWQCRIFFLSFGSDFMLFNLFFTWHAACMCFLIRVHSDSLRNSAQKWVLACVYAIYGSVFDYWLKEWDCFLKV